MTGRKGEDRGVGSTPVPPSSVTVNDWQATFNRYRPTVAKGEGVSTLTVWAVGTYLAQHADWRDGRNIACAHQRVADACGITTRQVRRAVHVLTTTGWLTKVSEGVGGLSGIDNRTAVYRLTYGSRQHQDGTVDTASRTWASSITTPHLRLIEDVGVRDRGRGRPPTLHTLHKMGCVIGL